MAIGAGRDPSLAFDMGRAIAEEARALGIQMVLSPVADVNNNPENPVINTRSFGEDPEQVGILASAFARGVRSGGCVATAKHFPGHGDTHTDSHVDLPIVDVTRERLESVELVPYRRMIADGIQSVMVAHLLIPSLEQGRSMPATLSRNVITGLLKRDLGFNGLVMTDALDMGAIVNAYGSDSTAIFAVEAGVDILLILPDEDRAVEALAAAVTSGRIPESRIDYSVRKILTTKFDLGLAENRYADLEAIPQNVETRGHLTLARTIARASITALKNDSILPLDRTQRNRTLAVVFADAENYRTEIHRPTSQWPNEPVGDYFLAQLRKRIGPIDAVRLDPSASSSDIDSMLRKAANATTLVVPVFSKARSGAGKFGLPPVLVAAAESLNALRLPMVVVSMGSPYSIAPFDSSSACLCAYSDCEASTEAAVEALAGEISISGRIPVAIPGRCESGAGIDVPQEYLRKDSPEAAGFDPSRLALVDSLMEKAIADSVFPGAQLAIMKNGALVFNASYGNQQYSPKSQPVTRSTLYDLASVTKVIATTPAIMRLVEEGLISLDTTVASYLPEFANHGKERITVRNLLLHNGGLPAFKRLYLTCTSTAQALDSVFQTEMVYPTGDSTVYSDFDFILLGKIVERVSGLTLDRFVDSVFYRPLGMARTMFTPPSRLIREIAPTEFDSVYRHTLVQGVVHDENAHLLGGVSGHAGLFSSASDLAVFMQMILNSGTYGGKRYISGGTIEEFTRRQSSGSSRALGWDTKSEKGYSSAGSIFGSRSFGHTGFTGTSVWVDPERKMCVILLTNRVFPTRANGTIIQFRPRLHDTVMQALTAKSE
jgi:beta-glucosidase-like glycosyl hydrolase/CubicO group peptidase (beta-lactamase class C family)